MIKRKLLFILAFLLIALIILLVIRDSSSSKNPIIAGLEETPDQQIEAKIAAAKYIDSTKPIVGESLRLEGFKTDGEWALLTVARSVNNLPSDTGSEGLIAIGRFQENGWSFKLQTDAGFNDWLDKIPGRLLWEELKEFFYQEPTQELRSDNALLSANPNPGYQPIPELRLPFKAGESYVLTTLPGEGTHTGRHYWALDFAMPEKTPLVAVADGKISEVKDNFTEKGCNERLKNLANLIRLEIAPGITVLYLHNYPNSALVKPGQEVKRGEVIGYSGATGFTCNWNQTGPGPHLHIALEKQNCVGNKPCTMELRFAEFTSDKDPIYLKSYTSTNKTVEQEEKEKREKEEARRREEAEKSLKSIEEVAKKYAELRRCIMIVGCDFDSHPDKNLVTQNFIEEALKDIDRLGGKALSATIIEWQILSTKLTGDQIGKVETKLLADATLPDGRQHREHLHITVTVIKEGTIWKIDKRNVCGFLTRDGKIIEQNNTFTGLTYCPY